MLPAHQIGGGAFIVGAIEVGLCERRAEPAIVVDDDVVVFRSVPGEQSRANYAYATPTVSVEPTQAGLGLRPPVFDMADLPAPQLPGLSRMVSR